ncbi:hypothetical protein [Streptomyces sp. NPDC059909]|uniref:GP88 family protein n=1 Tax=Streptomyces sp. NPDC059909 TaxID=3346998 RepID=UPI003656783F
MRSGRNVPRAHRQANPGSPGLYACTREASRFRRLVESNPPANFEWVYSLGGKEDHLIDVDRDRHADVFPDDEALQRAGYSSQEALGRRPAVRVSDRAASVGRLPAAQARDRVLLAVSGTVEGPGDGAVSLASSPAPSHERRGGVLRLDGPLRRTRRRSAGCTDPRSPRRCLSGGRASSRPGVR